MREIGLKDVVFAIGLITGFVFMISLAVLYTYALLQKGDYCSCSETIPLVIIIVASLGLFVGSFSYYFLMERIISRYIKKKRIAGALIPFLSLLDKKEQLVVKKLLVIQKINQAQLGNETGLDRVQVTRALHKLESKGIVKRVKKGKINTVELSDEIKKALH